MSDQLLKRYHFLTEDRRTVVYVLDYSLFPALIIAAKYHGPVYYKGHNYAAEKPLEVATYVTKGGTKGTEVIPFQHKIFRDVDS